MSDYFTIELLVMITACSTATTAVMTGIILWHSLRKTEPVPWDRIVNHLEEAALRSDSESLLDQLKGLETPDAVSDIDLYCAMVTQLACSIRMLEEARGGPGEKPADRRPLKAVKTADRFS